MSGEGCTILRHKFSAEITIEIRLLGVLVQLVLLTIRFRHDLSTLLALVVLSGAGDFMYVDPPYVPVSLTANFTSYAKESFGPAEQQELATRVAEAAGRGARVMLSNSDVPLVRDLYRPFTLHTVTARRAVNRDGSGRGPVNEVLVCAGL